MNSCRSSWQSLDGNSETGTTCMAGHDRPSAVPGPSLGASGFLPSWGNALAPAARRQPPGDCLMYYLLCGRCEQWMMLTSHMNCKVKLTAKLHPDWCAAFHTHYSIGMGRVQDWVFPNQSHIDVPCWKLLSSAKIQRCPMKTVSSSQRPEVTVPSRILVLFQHNMIWDTFRSQERGISSISQRKDVRCESVIQNWWMPPPSIDYFTVQLWTSNLVSVSAFGFKVCLEFEFLGTVISCYIFKSPCLPFSLLHFPSLSIVSSFLLKAGFFWTWKKINIGGGAFGKWFVLFLIDQLTSTNEMTCQCGTVSFHL